MEKLKTTCFGPYNGHHQFLHLRVTYLYNMQRIYLIINTHTIQSTDATHIPRKSWFDILSILPSLA